MTEPITHHTISSSAVQGVYDVLLDALIAHEVNRAEAVTGLLAILGTQFRGQILPPDEMARFVKDASEWLVAYFMDTTDVIKN